MKRSGLFFIFIILALISCTKSTTTHNYQDSQYGFHANFPKAWEVKKNYAGNYLTLISPIESDTDVWRENITFDIKKINTSIDIFKDLPEMYKQFGDALIEKTRYHSNGIERELFSIKTEVNGIQVISYNTLFRIDNHIFSISGMSEATKADFKVLFKSTIDSIGKE